MQATQTLPENYQPAAHFSMKDQKMLILSNLAGLVLLVIFGYLFIAYSTAVRPESAGVFLSIKLEGLQALRTVLVLLLVIFITLTLHEAVHGLGFRLLANARPIFAFRGAYAFAAAPGWYIPRNQYLVIGLAPFVIISLVGLGLIAIAPPAWILPLIIACVINASGAVGDLWVAVILLRQPATALANDLGDDITIYRVRLSPISM